MGKLVLLLLICTSNLMLLINCKRKRKNVREDDASDYELKLREPPKKKIKWTCEASRDKRAEYEKAHHEDYIKNAVKYQTWPELKNENTERLCQKNVQKLFPGVVFVKVTPQIKQSRNLYYKEIQNNNGQDFAPIPVVLLQCYFPKSSRRRYFHYIRAPTPHCVLMVRTISQTNPAPNKATDFIIINEFCNVDESQLSEDSPLKQNKQYTWSDEATPEAQIEYEKAHFIDSLFDAEKYEKWPELDTIKNKNALCVNLLNKLFPNTIVSGMMYQVIPLVEIQYMKLKLPDSTEIMPANNRALLCKWLNSTRRRNYLYIRSAKKKCVYLLKSPTTTLWAFKIVNEFCDNILQGENGDVDVTEDKDNHERKTRS